MFLASPGDVADERGLAIKVIDDLQYAPGLTGKITTHTVAWDKPAEGTPMIATMTPQEAIAAQLPKPSECDFVVVILWSRIGTPLPPQWVKSGGGRYLSGTEWECQEAMEAAKRYSGKPDVLIYYRTEEPKIGLGDPELDTKRDQFAKVKAFLKSFENPDGSIRGSLTPYETPDSFRQKLEKHLQTRIFRLIESRQPKSEDLEQPQVPVWPGSPFPGLRPFTDQDAPIFFGRGREIDELIRTLADAFHRFLGVIGASGSGKSSLVWAGLIPRLLGQAVPGGDEQPRIGAFPGSQDWLWMRFTPGEVGDNPFMALAVKLSSTLQKHGKTPRDLAAELGRDTHALAPWVLRVLEGKPDWAELLLFIDQFEELFTLVNPDYRAPFIDLLAQAVRAARLRIVVTMRADFYHRCLDWETLAELLQTSSFPLAAPNLGTLHEMITRPAERAGLIFEPGLVARILDDTGSELGGLALMAFALAELYEAKTDDGRLTQAAYASFEGVPGAIGKRAEDTFNVQTPAVQDTLSAIFRDLVEVDERNVATRRRAPLSQVMHSEDSKTLIEALIKARLMVTSDSEGHEPLVEVAHEALFRSWPRLKAWIQDTADDHRLRRQIRQLATYWDAHKRQDEHRWPDNRVVEVVKMLEHLGLQEKDFSPLERDFLGPLDRDRMVKELDDPATSHKRRAIIGVRLALLDDPREGVGLRNGLPDIVWCKVSAGEITLEIEEVKQSRLSRWLNRVALDTFRVEPFYLHSAYPS